MYGLARFAPRFARFASRAFRARPRPAAFRPRRPRVMRRKKTASQIHRFVRWCDKDTTYPGATGPSSISETAAVQNLSYAFQLGNCINVSDFVNLYDRYKINKVTLHLEPTLNSTLGPVNFPVNKKLRVVHDYTDNIPLTQEDDYLEYGNCRSYNIVGNRTIKLTLYPKILNNVLGGFTTKNSGSEWLSTADDDILHFGLKIFIPDNITSNGSVMFRVRAKYHVSMCNSK